MQRRHRALRVMGVVLAASCLLAFATPSSQAATAHRTSLSLVSCLSWSYSTGSPWRCYRWASQKATLMVRGSTVSKAAGSAWKPLPYIYNSRTHKATYDYRMDSSLLRPAYTSLGSPDAFSLFNAYNANGGTKRPNILWPTCQIHWTVDFHGAAGTKLVEATEVARWRNAFARVTKAVPGVTFVQDADSVYLASKSNPGFTDHRIHITYSAARGAYHSTAVAEPLGVGGQRWMIWGNSKPAQVLFGYVIIDANKAANMIAWPSPRRSPSVSEIDTLYSHELGHALGLRHTQDRYQVMYPQVEPQLPNRLGAGDIAGLKALFAASSCSSSNN